MAGAIWTIVIGLLALYGCATGLARLTRWMWMPRELRRLTVVPLSGHVENIEQILHCTTAEMLSEQSGGEVFLLDDGLDDDTKQMIARLQRQECYSPVITFEELQRRLQSPAK